MLNKDTHRTIKKRIQQLEKDNTELRRENKELKKIVQSQKRPYRLCEISWLKTAGTAVNLPRAMDTEGLAQGV